MTDPKYAAWDENPPTSFNVSINLGPPNGEFCIMDLHNDFGGVLPAPGDEVMARDLGRCRVDRRAFSRATPPRIVYTLYCTQIGD